MADYPSSVYSPRTKENKPGVIYDPDKKTICFVEDITKLDDEVVAIETELGANPKGSFASVKALLEWIVLFFSNWSFIENGIFANWTGSDADWWYANNVTLVDYRASVADACAGGRAAKITPTAQYGGLTQTLEYTSHNTLLAGQTYKVYYRYKVSNTNGTPIIKAQLNESPWTGYGSKALTQTDWTIDYFEITIAAGEGHDNDLDVELGIGSDSSGPWADIYIDWICIVPDSVENLDHPVPYYKALFKQ